MIASQPYLQVEATDAYNCNGYEHLFLVSELWSRLSLQTKYYQWYAKNIVSGEAQGIMDSWKIPLKHVIRGNGYKGDSEYVVTWPSIKDDVCSSLGLILLLGLLARPRGLAAACQEGCIKLLRLLTSVCSFPAGLTILPDLKLEVSEGLVCLKSFWRRCSQQSRAALKARLLGLHSRYHVFCTCGLLSFKAVSPGGTAELHMWFG